MSTCPTCGAKYDSNVRFCNSDGTVLEEDAAPQDQQVGKVLAGKYRLDAALSHGGMGVVYRATHVMLNKPVAVKLIKSELAVSPEIARRFQREARAASNLNHPNIAGVYDLGQTEEGTLYIAMELVDGPSLKDVIKAGGAMDPSRIVRILRPVVNALSLAHRHGIVHRDLKPQNIMLAEGEIPKLLDFGIAKTFDDATQLTATGFALGTPQYMSPEQALGKPVDARADIYSLGIILYEMLVGEVPFSDQSTAAILVKQVNEQPVRPSVRRPGVPPALEGIALRCMEKDRASRFQSADEVMTALDAVAGSPEAAAGVAIGAAQPAGAWDATLPAAAATVVATQPAQPKVAAQQPPPIPQVPVQGPAATVPKAAIPERPGPAARTHPTVPMPAQAKPAEQVSAPSPAGAPASGAARSQGAPPLAILAVAALVLVGVAAAAWQLGYFSIGVRRPAQTSVQGAPANAPAAPANVPTPTQVAAVSAPRATPATGAPVLPVSAAGEQSVRAAEPTAAKPGGEPVTRQPGAAGAARRGPAVTTTAPSAASGRGVSGAATPLNPSIFVRCSGAPEICAAARTAFSQAIQREGMTSAASAEVADVVLEANATVVDERSEEQFGVTFVVRTYTVDVDGRATRFREAILMPEPRTFSFDARYGRDRAMENARVIADAAIESVRAYWKKKASQP